MVITRKEIIGRALLRIVLVILIFCVVQFVLFARMDGLMSINTMSHPQSMSATVSAVYKDWGTWDALDDSSVVCGLNYMYDVEGQVFSGQNTITSSNWCDYQMGDSVAGYYDESHPEISVLNLDLDSAKLFKWVFYLVWGVFFGMYVFLFSRIIAQLWVDRRSIR